MFYLSCNKQDNNTNFGLFNSLADLCAVAMATSININKPLKSVLFHSSHWKRVIAWQRSRATNGYGIIWGDAGQNKHGGI